MICPHCSSPDNPADALVCRDCGNPLKEPPKCSNGHPMDPTWVECNYCRAEDRVNSGAAVPYRPTTSEPMGGAIPADGRRTAWEQAPYAGSVSGSTPSRNRSADDVSSSSTASSRSSASSRKTSFYQADAPLTGGGKQTGQKIIAVLVTYTWKTEGEIFPVREGRNRIGRDPQQSDICIPHDDTMSSIHSSISFRTRFVISDRDSMGGTYVNGEAVEVESYPLENYAEIRTGSTVWTFVLLHKKDALPAAS